MSGQTKSYCFDTNILIGLFSGKIDYRYVEAEEIFLSVISEIEYLAFENITYKEVELYNEFKSLIKISYIDEHSKELEKKIIEIRKKYKLKLPDAIIAATALINNATLLTNDKEFKKVLELKIKSFKNV